MQILTWAEPYMSLALGRLLQQRLQTMRNRVCIKVIKVPSISAVMWHDPALASSQENYALHRVKCECMQCKILKLLVQRWYQHGHQIHPCSTNCTKSRCLIHFNCSLGGFQNYCFPSSTECISFIPPILTQNTSNYYNRKRLGKKKSSFVFVGFFFFSENLTLLLVQSISPYSLYSKFTLLLYASPAKQSNRQEKNI